MDLLRLNTQRGVKTVFLTPKRYDEQPRPFYIGFPPLRQRALVLPSHSHTCVLTRQIFTKSFPCSQLLSRNLAETLLVLTLDILFPCGDWASSYAQEKLRTGGRVCCCRVKKSMCWRWRGAWTRAGWRVWDLGNGTIMLRKAIWEKTLQKTLKFSNCRKSIGKQIRPSCRKIFRLLFVFLGFPESNEI